MRGFSQRVLLIREYFTRYSYYMNLRVASLRRGIKDSFDFSRVLDTRLIRSRRRVRVKFGDSTKREFLSND